MDGADNLRLSAALADVEYLMGPLSTWPVWARNLLLQKHLGNEDCNHCYRP